MKKGYRHIIAFLAIACIICNLNLFAYAANPGFLKINNQEISQISISGDNDGITIANNSYKIKAVDSSSSSTCNGTQYTGRTRTLTFTNNYNGWIKIPYTITGTQGAGSGGSATLAAGTNCTVADGVITVQSGGTFTIAVKSSTHNKGSTNGNYTAEFKPSGIEFEPLTPEINFATPTEYGTFSVKDADSNAVAVPGSAQSSSYTLTASPSSGYAVFRWKFTSSSGVVTYFGEKTSSLSYTASEPGTITCEFMRSGSAIYSVNNVKYPYFDQALTAAGSSGKIVLTATGTLFGYSGTEFIIPNGVTLVLPYADGKTDVQGTDVNSNSYYPYGNYAQGSGYSAEPCSLTSGRYLELTIPSGTTVKNNGIIAVGGTIQGNSTMSGAHSNLKVDGVLELKSNTSVLSAIGYVYGSGKVVANGSGAKIFQPFSMLRMGSWAWSIGNTGRSMGSGYGMQTWPADGKNGNNPSPRFATQAIQCRLEMEYGDTMYGYCDQYCDGHYMCTVPLVASSGNCIIMLGSGSTLTTTYDSSNKSATYGNVGKLTVTVTGNATQGSVSLSQQGFTLDLTKWPFPVSYNFDIVLLNGTFTLTNDISFLPGAGLKIGSGATLNVNSGVSLAVFTGANDHTITSIGSKDNGLSGWMGNKEYPTKTTSYNNGTPKSPAYPANSTLSGPSGGSMMANLVVDGGTLNIADGAYFGGIAQTTGSGTINMNGVTSNVSDKDYVFTRQLGLTGNCNDMDAWTFTFAGETIYKFYPQYFDANGVLQTMESGKTYTAVNATGNAVETFTFDLYTNSADVSVKETYTETINATATGQWAVPATVTFDANGGEGEMANVDTYTGTTITLPENAFTRVGYTFAGWNTAADGSGTAYADQAEITANEDIELFAQWTANTYKLTLDYKDESYEPGSATVTYDATYGDAFEDGKLPFSSVTNENGATQQIIGWYANEDFSGEPITADTKVSITEDTTIYAKWSVVYMITFVNEGGAELENGSGYVAKGEVPVYNGATPTKAADVQYTYTFAGWAAADGGEKLEALPVAEADATYYAVYDKTVNKYLVKFVNEDGSELQSSEVEYGATPVYEGETPTKAADAQYTYTFKGWNPEVAAVTGEATYTAVYDKAVNSYTVKFVNEDGTELQSDVLEYGVTPVYNGTTPEKAADAQYTYTFNGWDKAIAEVTGDVTYTATYSSTVNEYTITFYDEDGTTVLKTVQVAYGATPDYDGTPTKQGNAQYSYTFAGWNPAIASVTGAATYTATYTQSVNKYTVTWDVNGNKTEEVYEYGATPQFEGSTDKEPSGHDVFTFTGWSPETDTVTGNVTYTAQYSVSNRPCVDAEDDSNHLCDYGCGATVGSCTAGEAKTENNVAPDCENTGSYDTVTYCTECDKELSRVTTTVDALGHTVVIDEAVAATCTTAGKTEGSHCSVCDEVLVEQTEVAKLPHEYEKVVTAPTCTEAGYTTYTCGACGDNYTDDETASHGHTNAAAVKEKEVAASCTAEGSYDEVVYCSVCGAEVSRVKKTVPMVDHIPGEAKTENNVDPDCLKEGSYDTVTYCTECGKELSRVKTTVDALGHDLKDVGGKDATCTEDGYTDYQDCSRCDYTEDKDTIPAFGHNYEVSTTAPSCATAGEKVFTCACGDSYSETIPQVGHNEVTVPGKAATCTETGLTDGVACTTCGEVITAQEEIPALGHKMQQTAAAVAPTCEAAGKTAELTCANGCGKTEGGDAVAALGHKWNDGVVTTDPTCTEEGVKTYTCQNDKSHTKTETVSALGHELVDVDGQAATCLEAGYTDYKDCSRCEYIEGKTIVPATGHKYTAVETTAPTCTEAGVKTYTCVCGDSYTKAIDATGHELTSVGAKAPTCTEVGWNAYEKCSVCDYTTYVEKAALNHKFDGGVVVKEATCTENGEKKISCARGTCLYSYTEEIKATGHKLTSVEAKAPTCTEKGWEAYEYCTECDYTTYKEVAATGHQNTEVRDAKDATCTETGYTGDTWCKDCETKIAEGEATELAAHTLTQVDAKAATCTEAGYEAYEYCSECDYTTYKEVAATGHQNTEVRDAKDATCTVAGYTGDTWCKDCETKIAEGEATELAAHTLTQVDAKAATCTEKGWEAYEKCSECDYTTYKEVAATGHQNTEVRDAKDATCTVAGYTGDTWCKDCETKIAEGEATELAAHTLTQVDAKAATCTEAGYEAYEYCSECDYTTYKEVAATGHQNTEVRDAKDATCTVAGYTGDTWCKDCETKIADGEATELAAHTLTQVDAKAATCTEAGYTDYKDCSRCDYIEGKEVIPAVGHNYEVSTTAPSCATAGEKVFTCACGDSYTETIPKVGHNEVTVPGKAATCTESGLTDGVACATCGEVITAQEVIPALGHDWLPATNAAPMTCETCGATTGAPLVSVVPSDKLTVENPGDADITEDEVNNVIDEVKEAIVQVVQPEESGINSNGNAGVVENAKENVKDKDNNPVDKDKVSTYATTLTIKLQNVSVGKDDKGAAGVKKFTYDVTPYLYAIDENGDVVGQTKLNDFEEEIIFRLPVPKDTTATRVKMWHDGEPMGYFDIIEENGNKYVEISSKQFSAFTGEIHDAHTYISEVTEEATCTEDGVMTYTCECGEVATDVIPKLNHVGTETTSVTAQVEGKEAHVTTVTCECGAVISVSDEVACADDNIDGKCDTCGGTVAPKGIKVNFVNYTVSGENLATITVDGEEVAYANKTPVEATLGADGEFTVSCAKACIAVVAKDNGDGTMRYSKLSAPTTTDKMNYEFTATEVDNDDQIIIIHKGDADCNGDVGTSDYIAIARSLLPSDGTNSRYKALGGLGELSGDADGKGGVGTSDYIAIARSLLPSDGTNSRYQAIAW